MRVGDELELEVTALDDQGHGRGAAGERTLCVPGLFPGERGLVRVEALARHSSLAHARLRELRRARPDRRALLCPRHRDAARERERPKPACAGCPLMALTPAAQREHLRTWLASAHGLELREPIVAGDELGYRWSSKRVVGGRAGRLRVGSRVRDGRIADMNGCLVDHPRIRAAFDGLEALANEQGIEPWDPRASTGDLRHVWAKTNGEQVLLTLITGAEHSRAAAELGPELHARGLAQGVAHSVQAEAGNAMRGTTAQPLVGLERLALTIDALTIEHGPLGFLQPNPTIAARAYRELLGLAPGEQGPAPSGALALDLYAGAGVTTRLLGRRFDEVVACESAPESAAALGIEPETAEQLCRAWLDQGRPRPELIVANPPRAGLGATVCAALVSLAAPRLHVMSCSAKSLARDLRALEPAYELVGLRGYDTLPQTPHVELVAWLRTKTS